MASVPRSRLQGVRAVVFDLDGTLLDTEPLLDEANAIVLRHYGVELTPSLRVRLLGRSRHDAHRMLADEVGPAAVFEEVASARDALLAEAWSRAELRAGVAALVNRLVTMGIPMAIATSSSTSSLAAKMRRHADVLLAMHAVVCADHHAVRHSKPAPDVFLVAARELGLAPADCVAIEDAPAGVEAALAAGMRVIAVPEHSVADHPVFAKVDLVVRGLDELDPAAWA